MYLNIGGDFSVRGETIVGVFDLDNTSCSKWTRKFLAEAQKAGAVVEATDELPKSFLVAAEYGQTRVYLTKYNAAILQRRLQEPQRSPIPGKGEKTMSEEIKDIIEAEKEYNASQIQVLEGLEAVRKRPGMYIGSTSASGLHHLVYEIVDNAVDEALAGYCKHVVITINEGNTITVTDDGRGIPVDIQAQTGKPALEVVYTVLHAGGKFGGGGYKVSGGLHGVGASVVNALSEWLEVEVSKDGKIYQMKFSRGHITQEMRVIGTTDQHGTKVTFKPDPEMFDTLEYDYETLHTRMREQAFLNAGLHITIKDERIESADKPEKERKDSMCYEGGIREFVRWYNRHKTPLHEQVIYMSGTKGDDTAEVALQYNDSFASTIVSFANDIHTPEGGMHEEGFKRALTNVLNAYGVKKGYIKGDDKVSGDDVREGLTAIVSVKLTEAQFEGPDEGQARQRLHAHAGQQHRHAAAGGIPGRKPRRRQGDSGQGHDGQPRARGCAKGQRSHPPQDRPRVRPDARQAARLQRHRPHPHRDLHRRGRLRRRLGHAGPRLPLPGDPAALGQDAERGKRPGPTRSTATTSSSPSSRRSAPASATNSTSTSSGITRSSSWPMPMSTAAISGRCF